MMNSISQYIENNDEYGLILYIKNNILKTSNNLLLPNRKYIKLNKFSYKIILNNYSKPEYINCDILQFIIISNLELSIKLNVILFLLSNGADPNIYNNLNETPLSILFKYNFIVGKLSILKLLLNYGAKVNTLYYATSPIYYLSRNIDIIKQFEDVYSIYQLILPKINFNHYIYPYCNSPLNILLRKSKGAEHLNEILLLINYYDHYDAIDIYGVYTYVYIIRLIPYIKDMNIVMDIIDKVIIKGNNITSNLFIELFKVINNELLLITILQKIISNYSKTHLFSNVRIKNILSSSDYKTNKNILHYYTTNNNLGSRTLNYIIQYINKSVIYSADKNGNTPLHLLPFKKYEISNSNCIISNINITNININNINNVSNDIILLLELINYKKLNKKNKSGFSIYYYILLFSLSNKYNDNNNDDDSDNNITNSYKYYDYDELIEILFNLNYKLNKTELNALKKFTYNNNLYTGDCKIEDNITYYFSDECVICFNDITKLNNIFLSCNHNICIDCFYKLDKCPICRHQL